MTADPTRGSYRDTRWGRVCVELHKRMSVRMPGLALNVGEDEAAETQAPPLVTFRHGGEIAVPAIGGGSPVSHPWDSVTTLDVECWGRAPLEAEQIKTELLFALNAVAHGRAGKPGQFKPVVGSQTRGNLGAKMIGRVDVRIPEIRDASPVAAESIGVDAQVVGSVEGDAPTDAVTLAVE